MARKSRNFQARRGARRPEWPYQFRELVSFLYAPERWALARGIPWSEGLERLREDLLRWIYHFAGAPKVGPDGFVDVVPVGSTFRPTARNVLRAANRAERASMPQISARAGDPFALSFPPVICEVAHKLAERARGSARAELDQPGRQWILQSMVQRAINALAAEERGEATSATDALAEGALNTLASESELADKIIGRFASPEVRVRMIDLAKEALGRLENPRFRDHLLGRVKDLLSRPPASQFLQLRYLEEQGLSAMSLPDGGFGLLDPPRWPLRAEEFPSPLKEALIPFLREADNTLSVLWRICPICARVFPRTGNVAKACPVCRRRYKSPLQVHRRLKCAPKFPVFFRVTPPDVREPLWLVIAPGVQAPAAVRRLGVDRGPWASRSSQ
jgi:hypothetical protein